MSQIFRVFIRHESDAQPAYIKVVSDQSHEEFLAELEAAVMKPAPSMWRCVDIENHTWVFRADKIYTVCVYPPESMQAHMEPPQTSEVEAPPATDPGTEPVADVRTFDDLDAVAAADAAAAAAAEEKTSS